MLATLVSIFAPLWQAITNLAAEMFVRRAAMFIPGVRDRRLRYLTTKEACEYVFQRSRWRAENGMRETWYLKLQQDMHDELCLGHLKCIGRSTLNGEFPRGFDEPLASIEKQHWAKFRPQILMVMDRENREGFSYDGKVRGFYDLRFCEADVEAIWPRLGFWRDPRTPALVLD
jgi:hypothetical protein